MISSSLTLRVQFAHINRIVLMLRSRIGVIWSMIPVIRRQWRLEWPTLALAIVIYGLWLILTWFHDALPWPVLVALGGWTLAWHGSLQHELIHGHPTRHRALNRLLGLPPLALFMPFDRYRSLHLAHHRDDHLTDPREDPESSYWTPHDWRTLNPLQRVLARWMGTLPGRLTIGPFWLTMRFLRDEFGRFRRGEADVRAVWTLHLPLVGLVLLWLVEICRMSVATYLACFVLPGSALLLLRSFAEHRAAPDPAHRTAIVEDAPILGVLFLFNNLHAAHHARPSLAWYRLPGWYRQQRERLIADNDGLVYHGYGEVLRRFLTTRHDEPVHPFDGTRDSSAGIAMPTLPFRFARAPAPAVQARVHGAGAQVRQDRKSV